MSRTAKRAGFEVVGHEQIEVDKLTVHPDAVMPIGEDDAQALSTSIAETGHVNQDLLVLADTLEVIDGCNRLAAARACGMEKIWCKLIRTDNPRQIVLDSLSIGRPRTTGQRIMAFIEMNRDAVIEAYQEAVQEQTASRVRGTEKGKSRKSHVTLPGTTLFHYRQIAFKLSVSEKDVLIGIKLFIETMDSLDPERSRKAQAIMSRVYAGATPIRRSLAALAGKKAEQQGREDTDTYKVIARALTSLSLQLPRWLEFDHDERAELEEDFKKVLAVLPDDLWAVIERQGR